MTPVTKVPCKLCGKALVFGITAEGTKIPLDASAPVYYVSTPEVGDIHGHPGTPTVRQAAKVSAGGGEFYPDALVTHFATCPNAGEFSKAKTKAGERAAELHRIADAFADAVRRYVPVDQSRGTDEVAALRAALARYEVWKADR